jgi:hypothetical protein
MPEYNESVASALNLTTVQAHSYEAIVSVASALSLEQVIRLVWEHSVSSAWTLASVIATVWPEGVASALGLTETITDVETTPGSASLALTQAISEKLEMACPVSSALDLTQVVGCSIVKAAAGGEDPCDNSYAFAMSLQKTVTFTYPYGSGALVVRAPDFGNSTDVDLGTIVRKNLGGEYKVHKPSSWPTIEVLTMTFSSLTLAERDALLSFFSSSSGYEVGYLDHENVQWKGVVLNQVVDTQEGVGSCAYSISIEFRGTRQ